MTATHEPRVADGLPIDTFGARLAVVRTAMGGWNVKKAAEYFEIDPGSWANWEKGKKCQTVEKVARAIEKKSGIKAEWVAVGGPLSRSTWSATLVTNPPFVQGELFFGSRPDLGVVPERWTDAA